MSRDNMFYWQSDRPYTAEQINQIFLERKNNYSRDEVIRAASYAMGESIAYLEEPINQGSVNIVCPFMTRSHRSGVIRVHPPQVRNEYFFVEREAMKAASNVGVPTPQTILVDDSRDIVPFDYMVMERITGSVMRPVIDEKPELHPIYLSQLGRYLGNLHTIKTKRYGFFDNEIARTGELRGIHGSNEKHFLSALDLDEKYHFENNDPQNTRILLRAIELLKSNASRSVCDTPTLVHNDIADWNTVVDGTRVSGILDWDECFSGDPVFEFATLSLFYTDDQMDIIKNGYLETNSLPPDYDQKFSLYVMRYIVNKSKIAITKIKYAEKTSMHLWLKNATRKLNKIVSEYSV